MKENFLLQNRELEACWRINSQSSGNNAVNNTVDKPGGWGAPTSALKSEVFPHEGGLCRRDFFSSYFSLPLLPF